MKSFSGVTNYELFHLEHRHQKLYISVFELLSLSGAHFECPKMMGVASLGRRASSSHRDLRVFDTLTEISIHAGQSLFARYGLQQGFKNLNMKKLHDTGTKFMEEADVSLHENVPRFPQAGPRKGCNALRGGSAFGRLTSRRTFQVTTSKLWSVVLRDCNFQAFNLPCFS